MVVPGSIHSPTSDGTNALLRDGARPILGVEDILESLGDLGASNSRAKTSNEPEGATPPKDAQSIDVLEALHKESLDRDSLQRTLEIPPRELSLRLVELEMAGWISIDRDGRLCLARARGLIGSKTQNSS